jgi:hypothetical protein
VAHDDSQFTAGRPSPEPSSLAAILNSLAGSFSHGIPRQRRLVRARNVLDVNSWKDLSFHLRMEGDLGGKTRSESFACHRWKHNLRLVPKRPVILWKARPDNDFSVTICQVRVEKSAYLATREGISNLFRDTVQARTSFDHNIVEMAGPESTMTWLREQLPVRVSVECPTKQFVRQNPHWQGHLKPSI